MERRGAFRIGHVDAKWKDESSPNDFAQYQGQRGKRETKDGKLPFCCLLVAGHSARSVSTEQCYCQQ
jgi:hypothetical protein